MSYLFVKLMYSTWIKFFLKFDCVSSATQLCPALCEIMVCRTSGLPVYHQFPEFTQTHVLWVGDALQPSHPQSSLLLPPSIFPSIRVFSIESVLHTRGPKCWSFSFSISPSKEYLGPISFRMDWLDLLASKDSQESSPTPHFKSINSLALSAFFIVQLSYPYMTTGKAIALTRRTFVSKVSLCFLISCLGW